MDYEDLADLFEIKGAPMEIPGGFVEALRGGQVFIDDIMSIHTIEVTMTKGKIKLRGEGEVGWHEEEMPVKYTGKPLQFRASPSLLTTLAGHSSECVVAQTKMKVTTDD